MSYTLWFDKKQSLIVFAIKKLVMCDEIELRLESKLKIAQNWSKFSKMSDDAYEKLFLRPLVECKVGITYLSCV